MEIINQSNGLMKKNNTIGEEKAEIYTKSLKASTKRAYLRDIMDFFGVNDPKDITIEAIQSVNPSSASEFRESLMEQGKAVSTVNRKLTALSNFYTFLSRRDIQIMDYNPFSSKEGARRIKQNKRYSNTRCLSKDEVKSLVKVTREGEDLLSLRNRIIILLLATSGMRRAEITKIKIGDIKKMQGKDIVEVMGKGDKERLIVLSGTLKIFIDNYIKMRGLSYMDKDRYLLANHTSNADFYDENYISEQTVYNVIKIIADKAGLDASDISPHCLRHTFATEALDMGLAVQDVSDMMGHADMATTRRYDHTNRIVKNSPADALEDMFLDK